MFDTENEDFAEKMLVKEKVNIPKNFWFDFLPKCRNCEHPSLKIYKMYRLDDSIVDSDEVNLENFPISHVFTCDRKDECRNRK